MRARIAFRRLGRPLKSASQDGSDAGCVPGTTTESCYPVGLHELAPELRASFVASSAAFNDAETVEEQTAARQVIGV